jgi:uncharacterized membrane protein YqjE
MADQASMRGNGPAAATGRMGATTQAPWGDGNGTPGPGDVVTNVAEFGENLLSLAELQARLAAIELKQNLEGVKVGGAVIVAGAALALAALPIALAGIAELLVSQAGMSRGLALIVVAVAALVIAGTGIAIAVARLRGANLGYPLSREEFARNVNWVRTVLLHSGRSARGRRAR